MMFKIDPRIFSTFDKLNISVIVIKGMDNKGEHSDIDKLLEGVSTYVTLTYIPEKLSKHELIDPWRVAYSRFGSKPSSYHSSVEALIRRILKGKKLPKVNKLVDLYNYLSLKHTIPIGAYDLDKIEGDIELGFAKGTEVFTPLNKESISHPDKGEVVYKDQRKVLCRRWNYKDCEQAKITEDTKDAVMFIEGLFPVDKKKVEDITQESVSLIKSFLKADTKTYLAEISKDKISF